MFFCDYQTPSLGRSGLHQARQQADRQEAESGIRALQGPGLEREGPSERPGAWEPAPTACPLCTESGPQN